LTLLCNCVIVYTYQLTEVVVMKSTIRTQVFILRLKDAFRKMFFKKHGFEIADVTLREMANCYLFTYRCNGGKCSQFVSKVKEILDHMSGFTRECGEQMIICCQKAGVEFTNQTIGVVKLFKTLPKINRRDRTHYATVSYSPFHDMWMVDMFYPTKSNHRFVSFQEALKFIQEKTEAYA
jgi:hypothetical protein